MNQLVENVQREFKQRFSSSPALYAAPGRINFIGEHTDYNDGFVMPAAIDRYFVFAVAPNGSNQFRFYALDLNEEATFTESELVPGPGWVNYLMGVVHGLKQSGKVSPGVDVVFSSNVPVGAGLSSSAALCCGFAFALSDLNGWNLPRISLAKIGQHSEHHFAGVKCGLMDQYASLFGESRSALLLDCRNLTHEALHIPFGDYTLLLVDTKVKHALASTAYNDRREACEQGVKLLQRRHPAVVSLREVSRLMLDEQQDELGEEVYMKCLYVIEEIARTREAARLLRSGDLVGFGQKMYETHWGLSQVYEVSCAELDYLASLAEEDRDQVVGARMMGGGFGGCTINLVKKDRLDYFKGYVHEKYFATFGKEPEFYALHLSGGVHKIDAVRSA